METRKIQQVGGGTFTVSVPKEWARRQGLETGEAVRLYTHRDGSLIVRGREADGELLESVSIPVAGGVDAVQRAIRAGYEAGFERIALVSDEPFTDDQRRGARALVRRLVGTEIVESDPTGIVVRAMLDASAVSIRQSLDQAVSIVTAMQRTAVDVPESGSVVDHVRERRPEVEGLVALVGRHYNRSLVAFDELDALGIDRVPLSTCYQVADRIEQIATTTVRLADAFDGAALDDGQQRAVVERTATLGTALGDATKLALEAAAGTADRDRIRRADRDAIPTGPLLDGDGPDPELARITDHLRHIARRIRAIERIGLRSAVHDTGRT